MENRLSKAQAEQSDEDEKNAHSQMQSSPTKKTLNQRDGNLDWLVQKGETADLIRARDWSGSPLGTPDTWPQSLRSAITLCIASKIPMYLWWGPEHINIYNDANIPIVGRVRHSRFFGRPAREMWPEMWDTMQGFLDQIHQTGEAILQDDLLVVLERNGTRENCYFSFSFNPAFDEGGKIQGAIAMVIETTGRVITEQKLTQEIKLRNFSAEEVARSQQQLHGFFMQSPVAMVLLDGPNHRVTLANAPYERLAGREVLGKTIAEAFPAAVADFYTPLLDEVYKTGKPYIGKELPLRLNDMDGNPRDLWVDINYHPFKNAEENIQGVFAIVHDVTEKVTQRAKEKAISDQLRIIADFSPALIAHIDSAERYQFMNRRYKDWFGFDPATSLGKTILEVVGPLAYEKAKGQIKFALSGKHIHFENYVLMKNGKTKHVDLQFVPLNNSPNEMNGFIILGYDITERKAAEEALRASEARYREAQQRLEFALASAQMNPWHLDLKKNQVFPASGSNPIQGYEESQKTLEGVVRIKVYPDDVEDTLKALRDSIRDNKPYDHEYRQVQLDGSVRWISSRAMPHYDEAGTPVSISGVLVDITERKLIADQYRAITELTPQFVWMSDEKGAINYSNSTLLNYMGVTNAETLGNRWIEALHPDDKEKTMSVWRDSIVTGEPYEIEFRIRAQDGSYGWFLNRALPLREKATGRIDRWLGVSTDITARKHAEEELTRTAGILSSVMATSSDLIYVKDLSARMVYCNPTTLKVLNASESEIYGKTDIEFLGVGNGGEETITVDKRIMQSGVGENAEEWITWPDGSRRIYLSHKEPQRDVNENVIGLIGISRDITERKAAQDEISKTLEDLIRERDIREKFVATLSHDLRTPLTSVKMSANLLARKASDPELTQKLSGRIADSIDRADQMIRDLLDANLIRVGEKLPLEISARDLVQIATDTIAELSTIHGDRFVLQSPQEIHGFWSESGIRRILENLCNNAIKYGDMSAIRISLTQKSDVVAITVHNKGQAIAPEDKANLFDPFKRTPSAQAGKQKGWGLGLTLVKGIAESHGGTVSVNSEPGFGTSFTVTILLDSRPGSSSHDTE